MYSKQLCVLHLINNLKCLHAQQPYKKIHESYIHSSFFRSSMLYIYVITAWTLLTALNVLIKKTIVMKSVYIFEFIWNIKPF